MYEIILRACFTGVDAESQAQDLKAQIDARMTNTRMAGIGSAAERTSYVRLEQDGVLVSMSHIDEFGILRQGEYIAPNPYPVWQQPTGANDSYPVLDLRGNPTRVIHDGKAYENTAGTLNSWAIDVFGWSEVPLP